jgi:lipopolysaccharide export system protein LptC
MSHTDKMKGRDLLLLLGFVVAFVVGIYFIDTNRDKSEVFNSGDKPISEMTFSTISKVSLAKDGDFIIQAANNEKLKINAKLEDLKGGKQVTYRKNKISGKNEICINNKCYVYEKL